MLNMQLAFAFLMLVLAIAVGALIVHAVAGIPLSVHAFAEDGGRYTWLGGVDSARPTRPAAGKRVAAMPMAALSAA
jgi:hypothetical protein